MRKEIIINSTSSQNRVAITEDSKLADFFIEHPEKRRMVGNIYLGKIARVLPGIRAAFIDIGLKHDAFLHFSDIGDKLEDMKGILDEDDDSDFDDDQNDNPDGQPDKKSGGSKVKEPVPKQIPKLHKGEEINDK